MDAAALLVLPTIPGASRPVSRVGPLPPFVDLLVGFHDLGRWLRRMRKLYLNVHHPPSAGGDERNAERDVAHPESNEQVVAVSLYEGDLPERTSLHPTVAWPDVVLEPVSHEPERSPCGRP